MLLLNRPFVHTTIVLGVYRDYIGYTMSTLLQPDQQSTYFSVLLLGTKKTKSRLTVCYSQNVTRKRVSGQSRFVLLLGLPILHRSKDSART
jgi:hypothetical protein